MEVVIALEEEFSLEIPDVVADRFHTPGDAVRFIHYKLSGQGGAENHKE